MHCLEPGKYFDTQIPSAEFVGLTWTGGQKIAAGRVQGRSRCLATTPRPKSLPEEGRGCGWCPGMQRHPQGLAQSDAQGTASMLVCFTKALFIRFTPYHTENTILF